MWEAWFTSVRPWLSATLLKTGCESLLLTFKCKLIIFFSYHHFDIALRILTLALLDTVKTVTQVHYCSGGFPALALKCRQLSHSLHIKETYCPSHLSSIPASSFHLSNTLTLTLTQLSSQLKKQNQTSNCYDMMQSAASLDLLLL